MGRVALALLAATALAGCAEKTSRELCNDLLDRLTAEVDSLPVACRRDEDCRTVETQCFEQTATSADEIPEAVTKLALRHRNLGCCGEGTDAGEAPELAPTACAPMEGEGSRCIVAP